MKKIIEDLLNKEIISPSESPYASAIVMVSKKSGQFRKCVDYRALNKLTIRDNYPLSLIEECLEYLGGKKYFSSLDLKNGFFHVKVAEESKKYTSFVTTYGQYEYNRMPFGLRNAPAVFQRFIHSCLKEFINAGIIIDDILIATEDLDDHMAVLDDVLRGLSKRCLELNLNKCKFAYTTIEFLGYSATAEGIRPNDAHIRAVRDYPMPGTPK